MKKLFLSLVLAGLLAHPMRAMAIPPPLPDLTVTVQANPVVGTYKVNFLVTVKNTGSGAAIPNSAPIGFFDLLAFADSDQTPEAGAQNPEGELKLWQTTGLDPGEEFSTVWTYNYEIPGTFKAWFMVNSTAFYPGLEMAALVESNLDNNIAGPISVTLENTNAATMADLQIPTATVEVNGSNATFNVTVQNNGPVNTEYFNVDVRLSTTNEDCPPPAWQTSPITEFGDVYKGVPQGLAANSTTIVSLTASDLNAADYQACVAVDLDNSQEEGQEANNFHGPVPFVITEGPVATLPDLVTDLQQVLVDGNTVTFIASVTNASTKASGAFALDLYYHSLTAPSAVATVDHTFPVSGLAPGASWADSHILHNVPEGTFNAWLWADRINEINESEENNNVDGPIGYQTAGSGALPDLVVEDVSTTTLTDRIRYEVTVRNQGNATANSVEVDVFFALDSNPDCNDLSGETADAPHDYTTIDTLAAGNQITLTFEWLFPPTGSHNSWVKLDCLSNVTESDETNNDQGPVVVDFEFVPSDGPDLAITDFKTKVDCTTIHYLAKLKNVGDEAVGAFQVDIFQNTLDQPTFGNPGDLTFYYDGLEVGGELTVETRWEEVPAGSYNAWVMADTTKMVTEANEGNNIAGPRQPLVDPTVCECGDNVAITSATPCACGTLTYYEGFCCQGAWNAEEFADCDDNPGDTGRTGDGADNPDAGGVNGDTLGTHSTIDQNGKGIYSSKSGGCTLLTGVDPGASPLILAMMLFFMIAWRQRTTKKVGPSQRRR